MPAASRRRRRRRHAARRRGRVVVRAGRVGRGELDGERGAGPRAAAGGGDRAPGHLDERLAQAEAEPEPAEAADEGLFALFEGVEDVRHDGRVDADAGVGDAHAQALAGVIGTQDDLAAVGRVLDRVADQVPEDLVEADGVAADVVALCPQVERDPEFAGGHVWLQGLGRVADRVVDVDGLDVKPQRPVADRGEVEQVVDDVGLERDVAADDLDRRPQLGRQ